MLRFIDGEGNECEQLRTVMSWGESLILPNVPDTGAPDMWKLEKNEKLGDANHSEGWRYSYSEERRELESVSRKRHPELLYAKEMYGFPL